MSRRAHALADELFAMVEKEQGYAFISDGLDAYTDPADIVAIARGSLYHSQRVVLLLKTFLSRHGHITRRRMLAQGSGKAK